MEYGVGELANMAGVSTRTLRYYDQCGLLVPARVGNGYRVYGRAEVDRLQQILLYRELGVPLEQIKEILSSADFDAETALRGHLSALIDRRGQLDLLIRNVEKTLRSRKGEFTMNDREKFKGFIDALVAENEDAYGEEIREKYGDDAVERSNAMVRGMTPERYAESERLAKAYQDALKEAFAHGDPASDLAWKACDLHRQWLCFYWPEYTKQAHIGVTQTYVDDPRFGAYYDAIAPGCAVFLRDATAIYCRD